MKRAGSGSICQRHGSADPDQNPNPHQNVMDPEHSEVSVGTFSSVFKDKKSLRSHLTCLLDRRIRCPYKIITDPDLGCLKTNGSGSGTLRETSLGISCYFNCCVVCSVADPGCLSRILIFTHLGSRIPGSKRHRIRNTVWE
jgi:hypothetical protein